MKSASFSLSILNMKKNDILESILFFGYRICRVKEPKKAKKFALLMGLLIGMANLQSDQNLEDGLLESSYSVRPQIISPYLSLTQPNYHPDPHLLYLLFHSSQSTSFCF